MKTVTIYSADYCSYCTAAKDLLLQHQVPFLEVDVTHDTAKREWLVATTGRKTVPQIFFGDSPIGGYTDLAAIVQAGQLTQMLS